MRVFIIEFYNLLKRRETLIMIGLIILSSVFIPWSLKNMPDFWLYHGEDLENARYVNLRMEFFTHVWYLYMVSFGMFLYPLYGIAIGDITYDVKYNRIHTVIFYGKSRSKYLNGRFFSEFFLLLCVMLVNLFVLYVGWFLNVKDRELMGLNMDVLFVLYIFISIFFGTLIVRNISKFISLKFHNLVKSYLISIIVFVLLVYLSFTSLGEFLLFFCMKENLKN
ncbi:hypothetical protein SU69_00055 [Thermosipho melanesiensis]|uniref:Uncharacterized protein n=2 Tax=Thermosipho melanesiensis TaxID=46541 RepID=A6LIY5_THEM4|nr:hypothetical protein [Thermosipho melanesiensis]ABR29886.1 hypothetical protein Tmel_0006 [Thermosipho melanesiensis BI429]APT74792.1 hypothetical protein BW47_00055 [Thermosipho melanesiensis]OOC38494.1 hypothetical protein SU68_00055 [Thermosipho melanesiensis]OOC40298.1 hypothetical protein SU70_00055 [Thermosipho melanesiensis]OOC40562.1 hypothetical protein SU69_00055 [Thermosipho melanesiensis]